MGGTAGAAAEDDSQRWAPEWDQRARGGASQRGAQGELGAVSPHGRSGLDQLEASLQSAAVQQRAIPRGSRVLVEDETADAALG